MTTLSHLRKSALRLPEVEEGTHFGMVAFEVRGKGFVSVTKDGLVQLAMADEDAGTVLERFSDAEQLTRSGKPLGVRVPLTAVNGMELNSLLEKSWRSRAPKRLVEARRPASQAATPEGSDALPKGIGKPATRALLAAGINTLSDVKQRSESELLALHGVGPRAMKLLAVALAEREQ